MKGLAEQQGLRTSTLGQSEPPSSGQATLAPVGGWNGRHCLFQRRLSYFTGVTEGLEPRPPWPLKGKVGTASARELDLAESGSVKDVGLGQPSDLWDLRGHTPFPYFSG